MRCAPATRWPAASNDLLHVAVRDLEHLGHLIKHDIAAIPGVDKVETMLVYSEVKSDSGWPIRARTGDE